MKELLPSPALRYAVLEKPIGQTPLACMDEWKAAHSEYNSVPMTYAGRLDPMASGKLLVLLGEECKKRAQYIGLDKEYEIEVVLAIATDTGDALGMATLNEEAANPNSPTINRALTTLRGSHEVPYPAYSSKTVSGKPLFQYALEGMLDTVSIPSHTETIYQLRLLKSETVPADVLRKRIAEMLKVVPTSGEPSKALGADFRQDTIRAKWNGLFASLPPERSFTILTLRVTCASGTYMRTLAERLGTALGTTGFALSINRTKIGLYVPFGPFSFWRKTY